MTRFDGLPNLKRVYGLSFKEERSVDSYGRYNAVAEGLTHITEVFSTDGELLEFDLTVLEDDKAFFPPYEGAVLIHNGIAAKYPELPDVLAKLSGRITDEIMRGLNYRVDVLGEEPRNVAEDFLRAEGLIG
jgi:glycine betaine/choline ABC-type transport system substrate-binding protein